VTFQCLTLLKIPAKFPRFRDPVVSIPIARPTLSLRSFRWNTERTVGGTRSLAETPAVIKMSYES
jgi:hypothetical protein